jgi:hypothetical protein
MRTSPNRIAVVALALLVLAGAGAFWWLRPAGGAGASVAHAAPAVASDAVRPLPQVVQAPFAQATGSLADACSDAMRAAFNARALELRDSKEARSQVAYALAVPFGPPAKGATQEELQEMMMQRQVEARRAFLRAAELAPRDPDVLWLAATQCGYGEECRAVQAALTAAEPDNMAVWQWEMAWAQRRKDPEASARAFEAAAAATRLDAHVGASHEAMLDAYGDLPMPEACSSAAARAAMRAAIGVGRELSMVDWVLILGSVGMQIQPIGTLRQNCLPAAVEAAGKKRRANCNAILARLAHRGSLVERAVAMDVMVQLSAGSSDAAHWRERYREHRWLMEQMADPAVQSLLQPEDHSLEEANSIRAVLEASDRWPPPADWLPRDERARSLILTGRPPPESRR